LNKNNTQNKTNYKSPYRGDLGGLVIVIADDITGAAEIAGVCWRYGLKVSFGIDAIPNEVADVCVVATDSRSLSETEAYAVHTKLATDIYKLKPAFVFKKCDSVLRGYVLTELSALLAESQLKKILLQPANPSTGRCIKDGLYCIGNELIESTDFSIDPDFPATDSSVLNILLQRSKIHTNIDDIHVGRIIKLAGIGVFIPDCNSINDLKQSCLLATDKTLLCGSAAFFEHVIVSRGNFKRELNQPEFVLNDDFLLVAGTTHPESKKFEERLQLINCPIYKFPVQFLQEKFNEIDFLEWTDTLLNSLNERKMLSVGISDRPIFFPNSNIELKSRLSQVVTSLLNNCAVSLLLIEGGATTYSILKALSLETLMLESELAPGILRMKVNSVDNLWIIMKPGSYPWPQII
jgi:D-threonate/D-erythronate kinase